MDWFSNLFFGTSVAHSVFVLALVIAIGIFLGTRLKVKGITIGITWILFCAIAASHFGMTLHPLVESFAKDFGLILFVYSIGLQVGPGFFSSFGQGGIRLNILAASIVLLSCITAYVIHVISGVDIATMTGVLFGAVTNTPGLGAAQQTFFDVTGMENPDIASGYAMAYPLGVVGIIFSLLLLRWIFRIKPDQEEERLQSERGEEQKIEHIDITLTNPQVDGIRVRDLKLLTHVNVIVTRLIDGSGSEQMPDADTMLHVGDKVRFVGDLKNEKTLLLLGPKTEVVWEEKEKNIHLVSRHIVVTKPKINGKRIADLKVREAFNITISRVRRAGIELLATPDLRLQMGDRLTVVGEAEAVDLALLRYRTGCRTRFAADHVARSRSTLQTGSGRRYTHRGDPHGSFRYQMASGHLYHDLREPYDPRDRYRALLGSGRFRCRKDLHPYPHRRWICLDRLWRDHYAAPATHHRFHQPPMAQVGLFHANGTDSRFDDRPARSRLCDRPIGQ